MGGKVEKTINNEAVMVTFSGQIELAGVRELDKLIDMDNVERDVVIFDFTKAEYISSSILGWLTGFRSKLVADNKREPIIIGCNDKVHNLFAITGIVNLFQWAD